ncbi:hypothetical protein BJX70DRAFT_404479 [Aspergillus crustosus]
MVALNTIKAHNAALKSLSPGLVAVFVGGTSGISLTTALSFARHTTSPRIYLIGRSQPAAESAIARIKSLNPAAQTTFLPSDISLLKNVDTACAEIAKKEKTVNILFMTAGYMTLKGRDETAEGLDRKFVLHYYARMRFVNRLLPLLTTASKEGILSRVVSVLDPIVSIRTGGAGKLNFEDLSLKHTFSLKTCGDHASLMNNFYLEGLARAHPGTSFIHAYPSGVDTGLMREIPGWKVVRGLVWVIFRWFLVPVEESGERHLFAATAGRFPSKAESQLQLQTREGDDEVAVAMGSDGVKGSGCYWLNWNGEVFGQNKKLERTRAEGAVDKVTVHTEEVFRRVLDEGRYP